jgi:4-hydroxy-2-oxoheptanedioate aldolase
MFTNRLKKIWADGHPVLNGWISIGNTFTAEIIASQGYDAITIDIQHGALDFASTLSMLQVMRGYDVTPMVRVPWREPGIIMKALDAGAQGIICPMINSAAQAAEFVSYMHYPPMGQRSYGPTRAAFAYGSYGLEANQEVLAFAMIETKEGIANLDAIAATPGLSGIYVGPSDLTIDTQDGRLLPGFDREEPEVIEIIRRVQSACNSHGIRAGIHCGTPEYAARTLGWGFDLTTVAGDSRLLASAAASSVAAWRRLASGTAPVQADGPTY